MNKELNNESDWEIHEHNYEDCEYIDQSYYEYDTGYAEYECTLCQGECQGGYIDSGCPLSFKYKIER